MCLYLFTEVAIPQFIMDVSAILSAISAIYRKGEVFPSKLNEMT